MPSFDPGTQFRAVTIRVGDPDRWLALYEVVLGLLRLRSEGPIVLLEPEGGPSSVRLLLVAGARPMARTASGLYRFAIPWPAALTGASAAPAGRSRH